MDSMPQKSRVNINDMNIGVFLRTVQNNFVVSVKYCLTILPCW